MTSGRTGKRTEMKVIYHCFGGSHSSVTAAAIHLGLLPRDRLPAAAELMSLPYFDARSLGEEGEIKYMGIDPYGNNVYAAGKKNLGSRFEALLYDLATALGLPRQELLLLNTSPFVNRLMVLGGFTSRRLGMTTPGRPIVILGTRRAYFQLVEFVDQHRPLWEGNRR
ncbi:GTP cyclohydrolase II [Moorella thermoacetica Y72]|nr:GTP cyclohydrolase II [Moorella thermoacetica Y72]